MAILFEGVFYFLYNIDCIWAAAAAINLTKLDSIKNLNITFSYIYDQSLCVKQPPHIFFVVVYISKQKLQKERTKEIFFFFFCCVFSMYTRCCCLSVWVSFFFRAKTLCVWVFFLQFNHSRMMSSSSSSSPKNSSSSSSFSIPIANRHHHQHQHSHYNDHDDDIHHCSSKSKRFRSIITEPISTSWNNDDIDISFKNDFSTGQIFEPFVPTTKRLRREQSNCCVVTSTRATKNNAAATATNYTVDVVAAAATAADIDKTTAFVEGRDKNSADEYDSCNSRISAAIDDDSCCSRSRHLFSSPPYTTVTGEFSLFYFHFFCCACSKLVGGANM